MNNTVKEQAEELMREAVEQQIVAGGSLLVIQDEQEVLYLEEGYADREEALPISRDTIYRMYSMSKPVTACAAMILIQQGKLDLMEPVSKYLPGFKNQMVAEEKGLVPVAREVFIRDLLSMTSGLVYGDYPGQAGKDTCALFEEIDERLLGASPLGTVEAMNKLGSCALLFQPGASWAYGTSADVMGAIIEVASGIRFGEFLEKELFKPLGMMDTGFTIAPEKRNRLAYAYQTEEDGKLAKYLGNNLGIINQMDREPAFESGGAGLMSTIDDYAKFAEMLMAKGTCHGVQILTPKSVEFLTNNHLNTVNQAAFEASGVGAYGYTYGNFMRVMTDSRKAYQLGSDGEYGWDGWLGTHFCNSPKDNMTILFMIQKKDAGLTPLAYRLRDLIYCAYGRS